MKRLVLMVVAVAILLPLTFATGAQAMRVAGPALSAGSSDATAASIGLSNYLMAAGRAYTELTDCACCCGTLNLPTHRCAACRTTAAGMRQIVARVHRVQAALARLDVPASLAPVHGELVAAVTTLHVSGEYMAATVQTAPGKLVAVARNMPGASRGPRMRWLPSPDIVRDARIAAFDRTRPTHVYRTQYLHALDVAMNPLPGVRGAPGEQALAHLAVWRDAIAAQATAAGVSLPAALTH
jgi:hypothetical protein